MNERRILDRYRLTERLASGGSAEVWRANDEQLDREVAVKRLHPHLLPDAVARDRLAAEARAAARLSHPGIVRVLDVDTHGAWPALVMEYVNGESLAARIARDGPLPSAEVARIGASLADALYAAHREGVIHRDVKPANVLIDRNGEIRLVDFGIAQSLAEGSARLTTTGTVMGTLASMAPEQLAGAHVTPRTDLYGLGVVLYQALTGHPPHAAVSPLALADAQRAGPQPMPDVDPALATLVTACLAYRVEDRPIHAGAVAHALRAWGDGDPAPALALAPVDPHDQETASFARVEAADPGPSAAAATASPTREHGPWRSSGLALGLAGVALTLLVAVLVLGSGTDVLSPAAGDASSPTPSPTPVATASPTPASTVPPVQFNGWQRRLADRYRAACGRELDPELIAGMNKKEAEARVEELIAACQGGG